MVPIPWATHRLSSPEAAWASVAPTALSPARTTTALLANPTIAVTTPVTSTCLCSMGTP